MKTPIGINVFEAAKERIAYTFDHFEKIIVSFSAGKDSTCMLHMVCDEARRRNKKIAVMLIDLEGMYKKTIDHAEKCREMYKDCTEWYWICLPIHLRNAVSVYQPFWKCWDPEAEQSWTREAWGLLTNEQRIKANRIADKVDSEWQRTHEEYIQISIFD